jgi:hypothetical protein
VGLKIDVHFLSAEETRNTGTASNYQLGILNICWHRCMHPKKNLLSKPHRLAPKTSCPKTKKAAAGKQSLFLPIAIKHLLTSQVIGCYGRALRAQRGTRSEEPEPTSRELFRAAAERRR